MKTNKLNKIIGTVLVLTLTTLNLPVYALTKEETVYSKLNNDGSIKSTYVTEHLINNEKNKVLKDSTNLKDILNINGNETFTLDNNNIKWNTNGNDIYYQGTTKKSTPIETNITYYLNNKESKLNDILGKKGNITIKIKYNNTLSKKINNQTLYTPFVVTTGTILSTDNNSNISVENGKVINNGNSNIIVGISSPGLYQSLKMDELKGLDEVTIKFDTTNFELPTIYSVSTCKLLDSNDLKIFNKLDSLYKNVDTLQSSINEIEEGAKSIETNAKTISDGTNTISSSINTVLTKLNEIKSGSKQIDDGLKEVVNALNASLDEMNSDENKQSVEQIKTLIQTNTATSEKIKNELSTSIRNGNINEFYMNNGLNTKEDTIKTTITGQLTAIGKSEAEIEGTIKSLLEFKNNYELAKLLDGNVTALTTLLTKISGVQTSITTLRDNIVKIERGSNELNSGLTKLTTGVEVLNSKTKELSEGTKTFYNGTNDLSAGVTKFNNEGIKTLSGYINDNVKVTTNKIKSLKDLANSYETFTLKTSNTKSTTKFVNIIDSKKKIVEKKETKKETKKSTIWTRIKDLFE